MYPPQKKKKKTNCWGIFSFGDAKSFTPKLGGSPVTGLAVSPDGDGLWVTRASGEVNGYGSVPSLGSLHLGAGPARSSGSPRWKCPSRRSGRPGGS